MSAKILAYASEFAQKPRPAPVLTPAVTAIKPQGTYDRRKVARRLRARESDIRYYGIDQLRKEIRNQATDWAEVLEISLQRVENCKISRLSDLKRMARGGMPAATFGELVRHYDEAVAEYTRFCEIYAEVFVAIEPMLVAARRQVASRILQEFPDSGDAQDLAKFIRNNTPRKWHGNNRWDFEEI